MADAVKKGARKKFFQVKAPLTATNIDLYGYTQEEFIGKIVKIDLTKALRGKSLELKMRVKEEGKQLTAEPVSMALLPSYTHKVVRKGTDYVEDSFETPCKDTTLRIKPFLVTRQRVSRSIRKELRNEAKKHLEAHVKIRTAEEVFSEITTNKLQKELSLKLKKIYPLALCEIRMIEVVVKKEVAQK